MYRVELRVFMCDLFLALCVNHVNVDVHFSDCAVMVTVVDEVLYVACWADRCLVIGRWWLLS